jgi:hypothetical protein
VNRIANQAYTFLLVPDRYPPFSRN